MPLKKLIFKAGVNRDQTNYANEGGWWECNKIRFLSGFPQKLGGWVKYTIDAYAGICRALYNWVTVTGANLLAIGTSEKIYVEAGGVLHDITPLRATFGPLTDCFTTVNGSSTVTVTIASFGANIGDYVTFSGASTVGGLNLNNEYRVVSVINVNSFTITAATAASGSATGGGTTITAKFQISVGAGITTSGYGWGASAWGAGPWGYPASTPLNVPLRLINFDKIDSNLVFNIRYSDIYFWYLDTNFVTRAVLLSSLPGASNVPQQVTQVMFDDASNILLAFGCTPYGGGSRNGLLIRWASQDDYTNWDPTTITSFSSTAGFLQIQSGAEIVRAESVYREILVFTESSLTSLQFTGTIEVFAQYLISADITVSGGRTVISVNNVTYWMGTDRFYLYNGRVETIPCTLRQHVFDNINFNEQDQFFGASVEKYNEIWWFYCSANSNVIDKYVIYNYSENIWYYGDCTEGMIRTAWIDSALRKFPQGANYEDNYIYNHEVGHDAGDSPMTSYITSSDVSIDDGDQFSLVRRIIPDVSFADSNTTTPNVPTVNLVLYPRNFPGAAYMTTNQESQSFSRPVAQSVSVPVEQYTEQVFVRARARQIAFKIESSGVKGVSWQLGAPRIDVRPDGRRS